ncbi:MAG TPA: hypothetical protein PK385_03560 [Spirochaetota bacterium]|nr:hypothetical protein [Spirochaetota bacterium]HOS32247.1 hypothetical protein [Spirochaetota bacterium]HOS55115.1 hypothetical protein [Spirochaetota bacterium]HPK61462.1 hypothetical protein [Spirochaetota bacterium]HQF77622.1 hypothetical protein [Spirochaetota bacterium]
METNEPASVVDRDEKFKRDYDAIERYFSRKKDILSNFNAVSAEEIVANSPKYYSIIRIIEQINGFINKDSNWLKNFIDKNRIPFDWGLYEKWKSGVDFFKISYDDTYSPSKWIAATLDKLIELLKELQLLLYVERYVDEEDFKRFLKKHPDISYKIRANYMVKSAPSENIELLFKVIDFLLKTTFENDVLSKYVIDTKVCMNAYRFIDESGVFELLKRKEFYLKYRLQYLKLVSENNRTKIPCESDIISVGESFLENYQDLIYCYKEYKGRLLDKYKKIKNKLIS